MGLLLFFDHASGFYSLGIVLGFQMGGAWFIASVGLGCSFGLSLGEWGGWILGGLRLLGFRGLEHFEIALITCEELITPNSKITYVNDI